VIRRKKADALVQGIGTYTVGCFRGEGLPVTGNSYQAP
jgi:murein endopeptidase